MKYYFKENFHLFYADGSLFDESGREIYDYQNETLFFPKISVYKGDHQIGWVKKNFTFFLRQYDIYYGNRLLDTLDQELTLFRKELSLNKLDWKIEGDFLSLHYVIKNQYGAVIAKVDQELFRLTQRFYVEIFDEAEEEQIILLIIAINQFDKDIRANGGAHHVN